MSRFMQGLRQALRHLTHKPAVTALTVVTLGLGIGATTAMFSVVDAVLIRPLPFPDANRLVMVWEKRLPNGESQNVTSPATFLEWRERSSAFEQLAAIFNGTATLTGEAMPERLSVQDVSPNFFSMLGANAALGRTLQASMDSTEGANDVVVISFELWQRRFGSDPRIVGSTIRLDGKPQTIVGVMPRGFELFVKHQSLSQEKPEVWAPLTFSEKARSVHGRYLQTLGLLRPGVTIAHAQSAMSALALTLEREDPDSMRNWTTNLVPLRTQLVGAIRPTLRILLGAVLLVLLIACANVATLLLARSKSRAQEIAIRMAMGATPWQIARQWMAESLLLAVIGGAAGLLLAHWSMSALLAIVPNGLLPTEAVHINLRVLAFTILMCAVSALAFGCVPALLSSRISPNAALRERGPVGSRTSTHRANGTFVIAEVTLSVLLLVGSGLLIRSFVRLMAVDPGFQSMGVLTARVDLPPSQYKAESRISDFYADALERIRQLPGVRSASADAFLPFTGIIPRTSVQVEGRPELPSAEQPAVNVAIVEPRFFETLAIPLLKGRTFTDREGREVSHTVVISQSMAKELWPDEDPVGKHVTIHMKAQNVPSEVIGVVGDIKHAGLNEEAQATAYWPQPELPFASMTLVIRTDGDPLGVAPAIQPTISHLDKDVPVANLATMDSLLQSSLARARFSAILMSVFAGLALLLAVIGIYGVISYTFAERTREIGIRVALGARRADVMTLVLRQGLILVLAGIGIGLVGASLATRLLNSFLFGVNAVDPVTFASVSILFIVVALAACLVPVRNALKVDPVIALRYE